MAINLNDFREMRKGAVNGPAKRKHFYPTLTLDGERARFNAAASERMLTAKYLTVALSGSQVLIMLYNYQPQNRNAYVISKHRRKSSFSFTAIKLANYLTKVLHVNFLEDNYVYEAEFIDPAHILIEADEWISVEKRKGAQNSKNSNQRRIAQPERVR